MAGNFHVEDIIFHLKELRQEKVRNEQCLKNLQQERKQLEKKVEAVSFQHTLAKEKSERSLDRLELAEKKLEQFAQQQRLLEEGNEGRREEVAALNATLERETASWEESCRVFEEELTGLAAKLRSARTHFTKESLEKEHQDLADEMVSLEESTSATESTQQCLFTELQRLKEEAEEKDNPHASLFGVPAETWILTRDLLAADKRRVELKLNDFQQKVDEAEGAKRTLLARVTNSALLPPCLEAEKAEE